MIFKEFAPGEIFTAADADNLLAGGRIVVNTAAALDGLSPHDFQQAVVRDTGRTYTYRANSFPVGWSPDGGDTGWQPLGLVGSVSGAINYRRTGNILEIAGDVTGSITGEITISAALPADVRPRSGAATDLIPLNAVVDPVAGRPSALVYLTGTFVIRATSGTSTAATRFRFRDLIHL